MNPDKLAKWRRWLGDANNSGSILKELTELSLSRQVFAGIRKMVTENPELQKASLFHRVFPLNYAHSTMMYVRRQVRRDKDGISLIGLADDLKANHEMVTRAFHVGMYSREWMGEATFNENFGGKIGTHLDPEVIKNDVSDLEQVGTECSDFIDWRVAHLDKREPSIIPTFTDIDRWCEVLNEKYRKFELLLNAASLTIEPVLTHNWVEIFRVPWLTQDSDESEF